MVISFQAQYRSISGGTPGSLGQAYAYTAINSVLLASVLFCKTHVWSCSDNTAIGKGVQHPGCIAAFQVRRTTSPKPFTVRGEATYQRIGFFMVSTSRLPNPAFIINLPLAVCLRLHQTVLVMPGSCPRRGRPSCGLATAPPPPNFLSSFLPGKAADLTRGGGGYS